MVIRSLVLVHFQHGLLGEFLLHPVGPDGAGPGHALAKVGVDRGTGDGLEALQLASGVHKDLKYEKKMLRTSALHFF